MLIGIPKEVLLAEHRVAALPETVARYVEKGFKVLVETSAGAGVFERDAAYAAAGSRDRASRSSGVRTSRRDPEGEATDPDRRPARG